MGFLKIKNIFWMILENHGAVFMVLLVLALIWGGILFFDGFLSLREADLGVVSSNPLLDQESYQELSEILETRLENLVKAYLNPFKETEG